MKLLDIDSEHLGIPDTQYDAVVRMSSAEYARICRDLGTLGESVKIEVSKEGVNFSAEGDIGAAKLTLKQGSGSAAAIDEDDDDEDEDTKPNKKKRKAGASSGEGDGTIPVTIELQQAVNLTFSHKYLSNFAKAAPLSSAVALHMSNEVPLLVEFGFENGHVRFYLAPKLSDVSRIDVKRGDGKDELILTSRPYSHFIYAGRRVKGLSRRWVLFRPRSLFSGSSLLPSLSPPSHYTLTELYRSVAISFGISDSSFLLSVIQLVSALLTLVLLS